MIQVCFFKSSQWKGLRDLDDIPVPKGTVNLKNTFLREVYMTASWGSRGKFEDLHSGLDSLFFFFF